MQPRKANKQPPASNIAATNKEEQGREHPTGALDLPTMTTALVDGDIVAYRCAASADTEEDVSIALIRVDALMQEIMAAVGATGHKVFLSGSKESNFRYKVDPQYKANRLSMVKPIYLDSCKEFLVTNWKAERCEGYEADDGMGMAQKDSGTVICSIDKDLLQVPGSHYNFVKRYHSVVTPDEGLRSFFVSTLVGDRSDNVIGVHGIGPVKAAKILEHLLPEEYYEACREVYNDDIRYHSNCQLLWIWRKPNDLWQPPGVCCGGKDDAWKEPDLSCREHLASARDITVPKNRDTTNQSVLDFGDLP